MKIRLISLLYISIALSILLTACVQSEHFEQLPIVEPIAVTPATLAVTTANSNTTPIITTSVTSETATTAVESAITTSSPHIPTAITNQPPVNVTKPPSGITQPPVVTVRKTKPPVIATEPPKTQPPKVHTPTPDRRTLNHSEVIGVWISYIELSTVLTNKTEAQFRQNYAAMLDNCQSLGINTVYVHLRPFGDALYESDFFPWSKYAAWEVGKKPAFDPLKVMLEESHKRNISFHGWLNPMRLMNDADMAKIPQNYAIGQWYNDSSKKGRYIVKHGNNWYLNPAYKEVNDLIANGVREITRKYNVDGIHIDDYFYPTTANSFDNHAFQNSSQTSRSQFRFNNINNMVKAMYDSTKRGNSNALFGISPQGSIENNYDKLYADVERWCKTPGYADYIVPQIYYGFNNSSQPFIECIARWNDMAKGTHIKLIFGLAVYKVGLEDEWAGNGKREWITERQILRRQIQESRKLSSYRGVVFFSYNSLFNPTSQLSGAVKNEINAFKPIL